MSEGYLIEMTLSESPALETSTDVVHLKATLHTNEKGLRLPLLQRVVLQHVRDAISEEIQRLTQSAENTR